MTLKRYSWHVCVFATIAGPCRGEPDPEVVAHYETFEAPTFADTSFEEVKQHLLHGRPFAIADGAKGLPMEGWSCEYVQKTFPNSLMLQSGYAGDGETNTVKMSSDWPSKSKLYPGSQHYPEGAPRKTAYYWDIVKAALSEPERKWGKDVKKTINNIVKATKVPYWLPQNLSASSMGSSTEMWFHPQGAGARAHMDPHCTTTVSYCFSGSRTWRMMLPEQIPHPEGYFDGEVYGINDKKRKNEWQPYFKMDVPQGSAVMVYPGMLHETMATGEGCSASASQTFAGPIPAAYFRAFWPRFALIPEDVGTCDTTVEALVKFDSKARVKMASEDKARVAGKDFASKVDSNGDGVISVEEMASQTTKKKGPSSLRIDEFTAFHDTDKDGKVSVKEVEDSWVMYATSIHRRKVLEKQGKVRAREEM